MARRGINGVIVRAYGARDHEATVTGTELLAPHFLRVRMASPILLEDVVAAPAAYVRFWMPDPDDPEVEHQRGYTLSEADPATGAFAVDSVLHDPAGPASTRARRAEPGTSVRVTTLGSTRFDLPPDLPAGYLLIGDAASIPAINGILGVLPAEVPVELYLEEHRETDRLIPLADHPRTNVHRVPRRGEASPAAAIPDRDWSDRYVWTAPESGSLKHLRTRLRDEFGFPRSEMHAQAYWCYGRAFGSNRRKAAEEPVPAGEAAEAVPETGTDASVDASGVAVTDAVEPKPRPGTWRARAGGRLLAPLRPHADRRRRRPGARHTRPARPVRPDGGAGPAAALRNGNGPAVGPGGLGRRPDGGRGAAGVRAAALAAPGRRPVRPRPAAAAADQALRLPLGWFHRRLTCD
ncbi:siderophore-interacting protein [Streptomyces sp. NPDC057217]|uniref:siderophore-interacting protein n=1 Tax=Streptomyces sp. NPDC057217 TaxID=3346054 RepID=UPI00363A4E6E